MLQIRGAPAFTPARLDKRLAAVRARNPGVSALDAVLVHFVDLAAPLAPTERQVLDRLLTYGPRPRTAAATSAAGAGRAVGEATRLLLVVPRIGTISPWSSKATDIAHICGLPAVRRIERGVAYAA